MFINNLKNQNDGRKIIIGQFVKIEDNWVVLKTEDGEIKVVHEDFDVNQTKNIMVIGTIENDKFIAEKAIIIRDDFNFNNFNRLVKLNSKFPEIF